MQTTLTSRIPRLTQASDVAIAIRNLDFFYGNKQILFKIDLDLLKNKITALIGPSGSGKSTLLRTLNLIYKLYPEQIASGEILFDNTNILDDNQDLNTLRSKIGMVFQKPTPFPMSIFDNIAFGIKMHEKISNPHLQDRVEQALRDAALWEEVKDELKRDARRLSGGQQQRLCIARSIAIQPEVLLLDEPTAALDPISTLKIEELVKKLGEKYTVIMVTHNLAQAKRVSHYTTFLEHGHLIEFNDSNEFFANPQDDRSRHYISSETH